MNELRRRRGARGVTEPVIAIAVLVGAAWLGETAVSARRNSSDVPERPPVAIVSASLSTDEIALALVEPSRLRALSVFADDAAVSNVVSLARGVERRVTASVEQLASLEPDLVLADPFGHIGSEWMLEELGVGIVRTAAANDVDGITSNIEAIGEALGERAKAQSLAARFRARVASTEARVAGRARPRVLFYSRGFTAGSGTLMDDVLRRAGGRNAAAEAGVVGHVELSLERVFAIDPDVLVLNDYRADGRARTGAPLPADFHHSAWRSLRAIRLGKVVEVEARVLFSTSHHAAGAVESLARALHPQAFGAGP